MEMEKRGKFNQEIIKGSTGKTWWPLREVDRGKGA